MPCAIDSTRDAILGETHRSVVNWEIYFFASRENKEVFDSDPLRYCGLVTDPVTKMRFRPHAESPRVDYGGRPFFFVSSSSIPVFQAHADSLAKPTYQMNSTNPKSG